MIATGYATSVQDDFQLASDNDYPNPVTIAAIEEVEEMMRNPDKYPGYYDVDQMMEKLLA